ncbi:IRE protein kinase [Salpingoeca rosetta]|uniref:IRE protein kinase n=1 Tax=Salpingoeca rosetta (strain ATCC 50818 / BSB-021) TaxID=946362 RepID=F2UGL2_SALR5|nr:IRE protein kinase [Salpingoeca rosetta]EGD75762.1 IRE protein kinase [Salpingoeca rosetta]|eukprot:XP_004991683.1 IRE protein kinase [Salpingoeca rosetta]
MVGCRGSTVAGAALVAVFVCWCMLACAPVTTTHAARTKSTTPAAPTTQAIPPPTTKAATSTKTRSPSPSSSPSSPLAASTAVSVVSPGAGNGVIEYAISCPATEDHHLFLPARSDDVGVCGSVNRGKGGDGGGGGQTGDLTSSASVRDLAALSAPGRHRRGKGSSTRSLSGVARQTKAATAEQMLADHAHQLMIGQQLINNHPSALAATASEEDLRAAQAARTLCADEHVFALLSNGSFCKLDLARPSGVEWCNQYDPIVVTESFENQPNVAIGFEDGSVYLEENGAFASLGVKVSDFPQDFEVEDVRFAKSTTSCMERVGLHSGRVYKACRGQPASGDDEDEVFMLPFTRHAVEGQSKSTGHVLLNLTWTQFVVMDRVLQHEDLQEEDWYHNRVFFATNITHLAFGDPNGVRVWEDTFDAPVVSIIQLRDGSLYQLPHSHFMFDNSNTAPGDKPLIRLVEAAPLIDPNNNAGMLSNLAVLSLPDDSSVPLVAEVDADTRDAGIWVRPAPVHSLSILQGQCEPDDACRQPVAALYAEAVRNARRRQRMAEHRMIEGPTGSYPLAPHAADTRTGQGALAPSPSSSSSLSLVWFIGAGVIAAGGAATAVVLWLRRQQEQQQQRKREEEANLWLQELQLCRANRSHRPRIASAEPYEGLSLHLNRRLGEGADNTIVFEGSFKQGAVAVKVIDLHEFSSPEAELLRSSHSQHVVRYYLDFERQNLKFIVMERCVGNLNTLVQTRQSDGFGQLSKLDITRGMLEGLAYLHTHGIVHRDIKPSNVLIAVRLGRHVPVIADLGLSRRVADDKSLRTAAVGTRGWLAPEVEQGGGQEVKITRAADIYSAGRVVSFLYTKRVKIASDPLSYEETKHLRQALIDRMTASSPADRLSAEECLKHKFCRHGEEKALADALLLSMIEPNRKPTMGEAQLADNVKLSLRDRLGTGAANTAVFAGRRGDTPVAVKCIASQAVDAVREIERLHDAHNHNVIRYYQHHVVHTVTCIVLEKCLCSLSDLVQGGRAGATRVQLSRHAIVEGMLSGLAYLHAHDIVHCDVKPSNVLIAVRHGKHVPVIADFGLSRRLTPDESCHTRNVGTPGWLAPEVDRPGVVHVTPAVDVYAAGMVIAFLYDAQTDSLQPDEQPFIATAEVRRDLVDRMTSKLPQQRPAVAACLAHPFFWDVSEVQQHVKELNDDLQAIKRDAGDKRMSDERRAALTRQLDHAKATLQPLQQSWASWFDDPVLKDHLLVPKKGAKYSTDVLDVIRALRNKVEHIKEVPPQVLSPLEVTRDNLTIFFLERFPALLVHVHSLRAYLQSQ